MLNGLRKTCEKEEDWDIKAYGISFGLRTNAKRAHGFKKSPFEFMFGREAHPPKFPDGTDATELPDNVEKIEQLLIQSLEARERIKKVEKEIHEDIRVDQVRIIFFSSHSKNK